MEEPIKSSESTQIGPGIILQPKPLPVKKPVKTPAITKRDIQSKIRNKASKLKWAAINHVDENDFLEIIHKAVEQAKRGDAVARQFVADLCIGKDRTIVDLNVNQLSQQEIYIQVMRIFGVEDPNIIELKEVVKEPEET